MEYIADLHLHSHYSMATSKQSTVEGLAFAAREKGLDLIGTGDFTHPLWRQELREKLESCGDGFYKLKKGPAVRFVVTGEISTIYKRGGKTRKVHHLLVLPDLDTAEALSLELEKIGNLHSDGRPILGLDSYKLLAMALEIFPELIYIPAHIWTPHFSLFGSKSGFDTIQECFGDLSKYIAALETGLSSDPAMNWRLSALDPFPLISNSDAHSPGKLGREATIFQGEFSYWGLKEALQERSLSTIEFFPQEGKYHCDGHRKCGVCLEPEKTRALDGLCPVCGKPVVVGTLHRISELADRAEGEKAPLARPFEALVPLRQILSEVHGVGENTKTVERAYNKLLQGAGTELDLLRKVPIEDLEKLGGISLAEAICNMRQGKVEISPGFDGEYGKVQLLPKK